MISGISAVAFDLDGTLYPNRSLYVRLLPFLFRHGRLLSALGRARQIIRREQEQSPSTGIPDFYGYQAQVTADLLRTQAAPLKEKIDRLIYRGWEPHFSKIRLFPHARELLAALRSAGLKLGLLSDFPPDTKLVNLGISGCWDTVLCSENTGALKPALRPFAVLAQKLGCPPEQILYVGNSRRYDVAGASRAGMKTALLSAMPLFKGIQGRVTARQKQNRADFIFNDYRQLRHFVL